MRRAPVAIAAFGLVVALAITAVLLQPPTPIRVGILHAQDGALAAEERAVLEATRFAIDELNAQGGVLGRPVEAVVPEVRSTAESVAAGAKELLDGGVTTMFGCWSSAARRSVVPQVEAADGLLFYPVFYEGLEQSEHVIYLGAAANQRIVPAAKWARLRFGPKVFLVGSDYVFSHAAHALIRDELARTRGRVAGESFVSLHRPEGDVAGAIAAILAAEPDVVLNTVNGAANKPLLRGLGAAVDAPPVVSLALSERETARLGSGAEHYVAGSYFESLPIPENQDFLGKWRRDHPGETVSESMVAGYTAVKLWATAVEATGSLDPAEVRSEVLGLSIASPGGVDTIDPGNGHAWRTVRIAQASDDGRLTGVWNEPSPVRAEPWPTTRSRAEWDAFLSGLHERWGGWEAPDSGTDASP